MNIIYKYLQEFFTKISVKIVYFESELKKTFIYHKVMEINKELLNFKFRCELEINKLINFVYYKYISIILNEIKKIDLFSKINVLFINSLSYICVLYIIYLKSYIDYIKKNISILIQKYQLLEKKFNLYIENEEVLNKNNKIIKQNKSISYSSIVSLLGSRQKSNIYVANSSLWPVFLSIFAGLFVLLFVCVLHNQNFLSFLNKQLIVAIFGGAISISFWITVFYKEKQLGFHTYEVRRNIRLGFYIFIFTEAVCFLSLFWTFLHALLAASLNIGLHNPGEGIVHFWMTESRLFHPYWERFYYLENVQPLLINLTDHSLYQNKKIFDRSLVIKAHINLHDKGQLINPYKFPLMNTFILLASACSLNASHTQIKLGKYLTALLLLLFTILLGLCFAFIQYKEIKNCSIQFTDGIYGSCFYSLTGLHGTHVILGIFGLFICFLNFLKHNYSQKRHDTYWFAILYWHFVDVVWILVYLIIYIWPSFYFHRDGIRWAKLEHNNYCFNLNQEVFESVFYYKLYHDRIKLNHKIINYAVLTLDQNLNVELFSSNTENFKKSNFMKMYKYYEKNFNASNNKSIDISVFVNLFNADFLNKEFINDLWSSCHNLNIKKNENISNYLMLNYKKIINCQELNIDSLNILEDYKNSFKNLKKKNFSILNNLENKSKIIDASNLLYEYISYFNYNGIKKKTAEHAIVLNIMHYAIFYEIQTQEAYDLLNNKYKIFFYFIFSCIDKKLCFIWSKFLTPYFL